MPRTVPFDATLPTRFHPFSNTLLKIALVTAGIFRDIYATSNRNRAGTKDRNYDSTHRHSVSSFRMRCGAHRPSQHVRAFRPLLLRDVWSGTTGPNWNVGSNWDGTVPGIADIGGFSAAAYTSQPALTTTASIGGIWDTGSSAVTIGGTSTLTLFGTTINSNTGAGIEIDAGAGPLTVNAPLVLQNSQQWINNSATSLVVNGNISSTGNLTMTGSSKLTLSGSNTYAGSTTVASGAHRGRPGQLTFAQLHHRHYRWHVGTSRAIPKPSSRSRFAHRAP